MAVSASGLTLDKSTHGMKCAQDEMMLAAARGLADYVTKEQIMEEGKIYPEARELRSVAATVRPCSPGPSE